MKPLSLSNPDQYDYLVTLKTPAHTYINIISQLMLLLFLITYFQYLYRMGMLGKNLWMMSIPLLIAGLWVYGYIRKSDPQFVVNYRLELMMAAMAWILLPLFPNSHWVGWGYALMAIAERWVKTPDEFGFGKDGVVRNSFPRKKYEWFEIENVVLRDNLFTLDLRSNKIIQKPLSEPVSMELQLEFNEYCQQQLHFNSTT